jgi:hypothetical protein
MRQVSDRRRAEINARSRSRDRVVDGAPQTDVAAQVREVSTERRAGTARDKAAELHSETYLAAVREEPCGFCDRPGPSDPHHVVVIGMKQERYDLLVAPACRGPGTNDCHDRAQRYEIPREKQYAVAVETLRRVLLKLGRAGTVRVIREMGEALGMAPPVETVTF